MNKKLFSFILVLFFIISILGLVACGKENVFNVSFVVGDTVYETVSTNGKENIKMPQNPTREGYSFEGWFFDKEELEEKYSEESLISSDITLYAKWKQIKWKIEFIDLNESIKTEWVDIPSVESSIYLYTTQIEIPEKREGWVFDGWQQEGTGKVFKPVGDKFYIDWSNPPLKTSNTIVAEIEKIDYITVIDEKNITISTGIEKDTRFIALWSRELVSIKIKEGTFKTDYSINDKIEYYGGVVIATDIDGIQKEIVLNDINNIQVGRDKYNVYGTNYISISYKGVSTGFYVNDIN